MCELWLWQPVVFFKSIICELTTNTWLLVCAKQAWPHADFNSAPPAKACGGVRPCPLLKGLPMESSHIFPGLLSLVLGECIPCTAEWLLPVQARKIVASGHVTRYQLPAISPRIWTTKAKCYIVEYAMLKDVKGGGGRAQHQIDLQARKLLECRLLSRRSLEGSGRIWCVLVWVGV